MTDYPIDAEGAYNKTILLHCLICGGNVFHIDGPYTENDFLTQGMFTKGTCNDN